MDGKYGATLDFNTMVACRNALRIHKAMLEMELNSGFNSELSGRLKEVTEALAIVESHL